MSTVQNQPVRGNVTKGRERLLSLPRAKVWSDVNLGLSAATNTGVPWQHVEYDTDGIATNIAGALLTIRTAGLYLCHASVEYPQTGAAVYTRIIKNNTAGLQIAATTGIATAGIDPVHTISGPAPLNPGDQISLLLFSTSATTIVTTGQYVLYLSACLISLP